MLIFREGTSLLHLFFWGGEWCAILFFSASDPCIIQPSTYVGGVESTPRQPRLAAKGPEVHVVEDALDSERRMDVHRASFAFDVPWRRTCSYISEHWCFPGSMGRKSKMIFVDLVDYTYIYIDIFI